MPDGSLATPDRQSHRHIAWHSASLACPAEQVQRVINAAYMPIWLDAPIPALDDKKPLDAIAQGDGRAVARLVSGVRFSVIPSPLGARRSEIGRAHV